MNKSYKNFVFICDSIMFQTFFEYQYQLYQQLRTRTRTHILTQTHRDPPGFSVNFKL